MELFRTPERDAAPAVGGGQEAFAAAQLQLDAGRDDGMIFFAQNLNLCGNQTADRVRQRLHAEIALRVNGVRTAAAQFADFQYAGALHGQAAVIDQPVQREPPAQPQGQAGGRVEDHLAESAASFRTEGGHSAQRQTAAGAGRLQRQVRSADLRTLGRVFFAGQNGGGTLHVQHRRGALRKHIFLRFIGKINQNLLAVDAGFVGLAVFGSGQGGIGRVVFIGVRTQNQRYFRAPEDGGQIGGKPFSPGKGELLQLTEGLRAAALVHHPHTAGGIAGDRGVQIANGQSPGTGQRQRTGGKFLH